MRYRGSNALTPTQTSDNEKGNRAQGLLHLQLARSLAETDWDRVEKSVAARDEVTAQIVMAHQKSKV